MSWRLVIRAIRETHVCNICEESTQVEADSPVDVATC